VGAFSVILTFVTPRLFFDTNICHKVTAGEIPPDIWENTVEALPQHFEYCISPLTALETVHSLTTCSPKFFDRNRARVMHLTAVRNRLWLDYPIPFQRTALTGLPTKNNWEIELNLTNLFAILRWVENKQDLDRPVSLPYMTDSFGFRTRLGDALAMFREIKDLYASRMEYAQGQEAKNRRRRDYIDDVFRVTGLVQTEERIAAASEGLDAAFQFEYHLFSMLRSPYNFRANTSDLIDAQQLYYLLDPTLHFVTGDDRLVGYVRKSAQANRIMTFSQLLDVLR
jgi:hypothetical protein